jgi:hypothetical protein
VNDIETGAFEVTDDLLATSKRLLAKVSDPQIWFVRIGHPAVGRRRSHPLHLQTHDCDRPKKHHLQHKLPPENDASLSAKTKSSQVRFISSAKNGLMNKSKAATWLII